MSGTVGWTYDNDLRVGSESVNSAHTATFAYDADGLLTRAGTLSIDRDPQTGFVVGTSLGSVTDSYTYNSHGEVSRYTARFGTTELFDLQYARDDLGRITQKTETIAGVSRAFGYEYDQRGRLSTVRRNGDVTAAYTYDANGNRLSVAGEQGFFTATYNDRDQLLTSGSTSYTYNPNGELETKTEGGLTTTYDFDALGNLRGVTLPSRTRIEHVLDGVNRRLGKKVNGTLVQRWVYTHALRLAAGLDGAGNVVARFVYGTKLTVPEYIVKSGKTYRIVTDHLGSVRLVIDVPTGAVAQQLDYDEWGNIILDTNPGFQPFAFTGREWDPETGLYYHRNRYYDPKVGRFVSQDPIGFRGGVNVYTYAGGSPVSFIDPFGLDWVYSQSTGSLTHVDANGNSTNVGTGYAGGNQGHNPEGVNNPAMQNVPNVGPLPEGRYSIGLQQDNTTVNGHTLPASMRLIPDPNNQMSNRGGFLIHGDNAAQNRSASQGCPVLGRDIRDQIGRSNDRTLRVVP